ncbi:MAG: serine/threonine protein kinase [Phycisphaerales bacterium]|nr:MAG: serine/threonine protein kinase [Phycisphaerales bacterium]
MAFTFKHGDRPLEGYTVHRGVGRGGFGEVYYAISDGGREVALKYLRENPQVELRGVSHCINLKSPHLVTIFDVKKNADDDYFILMEYVSGPSLRDLLVAQPGGLGAQKAAFFLRELAKGLSYLHDRGIVHRDLKPGNVFYDDGYVKIGDYGLSKFISVSRHSAQTASVGTVHYMAPEVGSGDYSRGIDIYALGVILYEMLLGKVPFEGGSMGEVLMKHLTAQPELDDLPAPFAAVIRKALAKDPNDRYQTVDEMVNDIFDVDDVRNSLAGFNPTSLSQAAARVARDLPDSPVPSPNPPPPPPPEAAGAWGAELPPRLGRRARRIEHKIARRMQALDRRAGKKAAPQGGGPSMPVAAPPATTRGFILAWVVMAAISIGVGILFGCLGRDDDGLAPGFLTFGLSLGLALGHRMIRWIGGQAEPEWVQRLILALCCAVPMAIGGAIADDTHMEPGPLVMGLAAVVLFIDWRQRIRSGASGELGVGHAFTAGVVAFIVAMFADWADADMAWVAGGVAAAVSLAVQAGSWFWPPLYALTPGPPASQDASVKHTWRRRPHADSPPLASPVQADTAAPPAQAEPGTVPFGIPVEPGSRHAKPASTEPLPPLRWGVTRAFWSVVAFCLFGAAVGTFLMPVLGVVRIDDDQTAAIVASIASVSLLIPVLSKTTQRRRRGFWRETARPFLIACALIGIGASLTFLSIYGASTPEEKWGVIAAMVMSGALLMVSLFVGSTWRRARLLWLLVPIVLVLLALLFARHATYVDRIEVQRAEETWVLEKNVIDDSTTGSGKLRATVRSRPGPVAAHHPPGVRAVPVVAVLAAPVVVIGLVVAGRRGRWDIAIWLAVLTILAALGAVAFLSMA